jgi:threonine/homoserine/homoserine lactone efflux protein
MTLTFVVTCLVICVSPGTGALYSIAAGLTRGARAGVLAAFACTLGVVPHAAAAITGLAAVLHASGVAFAIVKYAGVAYLVYLAWTTWRDTGALSVDREHQRHSARQVIVAGITLNLLNPKLTVFFFAFLPQFVPASASHGFVRMVGLSAVFMLITFLTFVGYALLAAATRERVLGRPQVLARLRKVFAACFLVLSGRLALESR